MKSARFTWDPEKAAENLRKHGVSSEEGCTVFADENARLKHDPDHSREEDRFVLLGLSAGLRILIVCHSCRQSDGVVRVISVRKATPRERGQYGSHL